MKTTEEILEKINAMGLEAEQLAHKCFGEGPGKMVDSVRFESMNELSFQLKHLKQFINGEGHQHSDESALAWHRGCCG